MSPEAFRRWLIAMRDANLARTDAVAARLLGVTANSLGNYKRRGASQSVALACSALLHRLPPFGSER